MKSIVVTQFGEPPKIVVEDRLVPAARDGYTLVRVVSATINQLSNIVRSGGFPGVTAPIVLGNEGAGIVEAGTRFEAGTRVVVYGAGQLGVKEDGLHQQSILVEDRRVFPLPETLDFDEGSAITVNYITAFQALARVAKLTKGQTVLVSGATGSLGHALMQMVAAFEARPIAIVSTKMKAQRALAAGAATVIDLSSEDLTDAVLAATDGQGADLAVDPVGGSLTGQLLRSVRPRGTVVAIGFAGGLQASCDLLDLIVHEKRLLGYDLHLEEDQTVQDVMAKVLAFASTGLLRPMIDSQFSISEYEAGYRRLASRDATGAVILRL